MSTLSTQCNYFNLGQCKSCTRIELAYHLQLEKKISTLEAALVAAKLIHPQIALGFQAQNPFNYRNRAKFVVAGTIEQPLIGMADNAQNVIDLPLCPLHATEIVSLAPILKETISKYKLTPYDIKTRQGELKAIIVRVGSETQEIMVRFILRSRSLEKRVRNAASYLQELNSNIKVVTLNIQPKPAAILEGEEEEILTAATQIHETLRGFDNRKIHFGISPKSFSQVSSKCAESLYRRAAEEIAKTPGISLLDLFCGTGCFSIFAAHSAENSLGIELSESSINDAIYSANLNGISNCNYIVGDASAFGKSIERIGGNKSPDIILVNPPRRGLGESICREINAINPQKIIYSSCNHETLIADLKLLSGHEIKSVEIFDMFPQTEHFETLVVAEKISLSANN
jgi:23S rRNA (uracil747-C5)-methyltransferase